MTRSLRGCSFHRQNDCHCCNVQEGYKLSELQVVNKNSHLNIPWNASQLVDHFAVVQIITTHTID